MLTREARETSVTAWRPRVDLTLTSYFKRWHGMRSYLDGIKLNSNKKKTRLKEEQQKKSGSDAWCISRFCSAEMPWLGQSCWCWLRLSLPSSLRGGAQGLQQTLLGAIVLASNRDKFFFSSPSSIPRLEPRGFHSRANLVMLFVGFRKVCPIHFYFLLLMVSSMRL